MDRSFLSQADVVDASRNFVCIRLTTYENEYESIFSQKLYPTRSGEVENTTIGLLAPDGKTKLSKTGRGTRMLYASPKEMVAAMTEIAKKYPADAEAAKTVAKLPITLDAKLGVNVAAADGLPLIAVLVADDKSRTATSDKVAKLAWDKQYLGRFIYCEAKSSDDFPKLEGLKPDDAILLIEPDNFGQAGQVVKRLPITASQDELDTAMKEVLKRHQVSVKTMREHRDAGIKAGAFWETKNPVTDKQELNARNGAKRDIEKRRKP